MPLDRIAHQLGVGRYAKDLHDPVLVKADGARRNMKRLANFDHGPPFGQELQHFALARCEWIAQRVHLGAENIFKARFESSFERYFSPRSTERSAVTSSEGAQVFSR